MRKVSPRKRLTRLPQVFDAAQLDTNVNCLYYYMSGPNDPTKAVALITDAVQKAQAELGKIADGSVKATSRSLDAGFHARKGIRSEIHMISGYQLEP